MGVLAALKDARKSSHPNDGIGVGYGDALYIPVEPGVRGAPADGRAPDVSMCHNRKLTKPPHS